tara:strand:+ start:316 stop:513 length:198 start_codon:yes stop_codon:yes gene_type:complete
MIKLILKLFSLVNRIKYNKAQGLRLKAQEKKINYVWLYMMSHQNIGVIGVCARNRQLDVRGPDNG